MTDHPPTKRPRRLLQQPKPVVQRFTRRWVHRKLWPTMLAATRAYMRWKLPRDERERQNALKEAFESTAFYAVQNEKRGYPANAVVLNIALHLLMAERDIQAIKIDALTHPDEWTRKLQARMIALTIYEWEFDKVAGQALRNALDLIEAPDDLKQEVSHALRHLRKVQERVRSKFGELRHKTIAHRDPDALLVYRAIERLDVMEVMQEAGEFYQGVTAFMGVMTKLMHHSSSLSAILRQWTVKNAAQA